MESFETPSEPPTQRTLHGSHCRYHIEVFVHTDGTKWTRITQEDLQGGNRHEIVIDQDLGFAIVRALQDLGAAPPPPEPPRKRRGFSGKHMSMRERNANTEWTPAQDSLLITLFTDGVPLNELALCLGRTAAEIDSRLRRFSLKSEWEEEEITIYQQQHAR